MMVPRKFFLCDAVPSVSLIYCDLVLPAKKTKGPTVLRKIKNSVEKKQESPCSLTILLFQEHIT